VSLLRAFLGFGSVVHNLYFLVKALELYETQDKLSIVGCYVATEVVAYDNKLATFDKDLQRYAGDKLVS
jgi:hypothetical protein